MLVIDFPIIMCDSSNEKGFRATHDDNSDRTQCNTIAGWSPGHPPNECRLGQTTTNTPVLT